VHSEVYSIYTHQLTHLYIILKKFKIYIKTLKTLLHISIIRSSSWSTHCSLLKLYIKTICDVIRVDCMFLFNTSLFYLMVQMYLHLLSKVQLRVSALDNSHLQVVHESLGSSYTKFNMGCVLWGCGRWGEHEISYVSWRLWGGYMG